jgi:hypothetical protein
MKRRIEEFLNKQDCGIRCFSERHMKIAKKRKKKHHDKNSMNKPVACRTIIMIVTIGMCVKNIGSKRYQKKQANDEEC